MTTLGKQQKNQARKGALLDKYFESNDLSIVETEEFLKIFANYVNANKSND